MFKKTDFEIGGLGVSVFKMCVKSVYIYNMFFIFTKFQKMLIM